MSEQDETPQDEPRHVTAQAGLAQASAQASGQEQDEPETADTEDGD